jgi:hypothetical protein
VTYNLKYGFDISKFSNDIKYKNLQDLRTGWGWMTTGVGLWDRKARDSINLVDFATLWATFTGTKEYPKYKVAGGYLVYVILCIMNTLMITARMERLKSENLVN